MKNMSEEKLKEVSGGIYDLVDTQVNGDMTSYTFRRQGGTARSRRNTCRAESLADETSVLNALPVDVANFIRRKHEERMQELFEKGGCVNCAGIVPSARGGLAGFKLNINNATGEISYDIVTRRDLE